MKYLTIAFSKKVFPTALKVSLVVGTLLAVINHYPAMQSLSLSSENVFQILLTYLVPYSVSTYSSIKVILSNE